MAGKRIEEIRFYAEDSSGNFVGLYEEGNWITLHLTNGKSLNGKIEHIDVYNIYIETDDYEIIGVQYDDIVNVEEN